MKTAPSTVVLLLLAGCATQPTYEWRHSQHDDRARFDQDAAQCRYESAAATGSYSPNNRGYRTAFGRALADAIDMSSRQTDIAILCMKARGYYQAPILAASTPPPAAYAQAVATVAPPALTTAPPVEPLGVPAVKAPMITRPSFDIARVDLLEPGISREADAIALLGKPNAETGTANKQRVLQWAYSTVRSAAHAAILFDGDGIMIRVTHKFSSGQ